jgi:hypothetical protein
MPSWRRKGPKLAVAGIVDIPGGTEHEQQYEQVIATVFPEGKLPESWHVHLAGLLGLGVAVIGNVLYQLAPGFLLSCLAILGDLMVLMSVGRWIYERVRHHGQG